MKFNYIGEQSPRSQLEGMLSYNLTQMLYVVVKLGIPDLLRQGPRSAEELASRVNAHPRSLFRLMRALASQGVFTQDDGDNFSLTPISELLCVGVAGSFRSFALSYGEPWWWEAWGSLLQSIKTGETAFNIANGTSLFDFLAQNPEAAGIFNDNMTSMTSGEAQAVVAAYDFSSTGVLVDVGGGQGALVTAIMHTYPQLSAVLFDLPSVIAGTRARLEAAGIAERCMLVGGNFFESIPPGGDTYLLKDILHDWDDSHAIKILSNVRLAMRAASHLLVIERVIFADEASIAAKMVDINMLVMSGGMERTEDDYRALLDAGGFKLTQIIPTTAGTSLIEAMPALNV